jgi:hypothetical protein
VAATGVAALATVGQIVSSENLVAGDRIAVGIGTRADGCVMGGNDVGESSVRRWQTPWMRTIEVVGSQRRHIANVSGTVVDSADALAKVSAPACDGGHTWACRIVTNFQGGQA